MSELQGIVRFRFHPGKVEDFKQLSRQAMEIVRNEPGTLQYETYFNEAETEAMALERFTDSQALIDHGQNMAALMEPIMACGEVSGELLGELSPELRALMTGDQPRLFPLRFMSLQDR
jgi:quinol monooxygenase YgiN